MQGDAVLHGFSMCILVMKVPGSGGPDRGMQLVLHAFPELFGRFRCVFENVRQLATATETSRFQFATEM